MGFSESAARSLTCERAKIPCYCNMKFHQPGFAVSFWQGSFPGNVQFLEQGCHTTN
jgi:hypothetical protein